MLLLAHPPDSFHVRRPAVGTGPSLGRIKALIVVLGIMALGGLLAELAFIKPDEGVRRVEHHSSRYAPPVFPADRQGPVFFTGQDVSLRPRLRCPPPEPPEPPVDHGQKPPPDDPAHLVHALQAFFVARRQQSIAPIRTPSVT